jgi:hypothetical protein
MVPAAKERKSISQSSSAPDLAAAGGGQPAAGDGGAAASKQQPKRSAFHVPLIHVPKRAPSIFPTYEDFNQIDSEPGPGAYDPPLSCLGGQVQSQHSNEPKVSILAKNEKSWSKVTKFFERVFLRF